MGVGAYLFGEGYPSPMFQNGEGSFTNILAKLSKNGASPALDGFLSGAQTHRRHVEKSQRCMQMTQKSYCWLYSTNMAPSFTNILSAPTPMNAFVI